MESRHSIQELREENLIQDNLNSALSRMIERFRMDNNTVIEFEPPPSLRFASTKQAPRPPHSARGDTQCDQTC